MRATRYTIHSWQTRHGSDGERGAPQKRESAQDDAAIGIRTGDRANNTWFGKAEVRSSNSSRQGMAWGMVMAHS